MEEIKVIIEERRIVRIRLHQPISSCRAPATNSTTRVVDQIFGICGASRRRPAAPPAARFYLLYTTTIKRQQLIDDRA